MVQGISRNHDRKAAVGVRQRVGIAPIPGDVAKAPLSGKLAGSLEHCWSQVDACRLPDVSGKGAHHRPGPQATSRIVSFDLA